eukprot:scaffold163480_cov26-Tisochrysis_lutea.AAC.1
MYRTSDRFTSVSTIDRPAEAHTNDNDKLSSADLAASGGTRGDMRSVRWDSSREAHPPRLRSTLVVVAADAMLPKAAAAGMAGVAAVADRPVVEVAVGRRVLVIAVAMDRPEGVAAAAGMDHPTACIGVEDSHPAVAAAAELAFWWAWHQAGAIVARCGPSWAHRA